MAWAGTPEMMRDADEDDEVIYVVPHKQPIFIPDEAGAWCGLSLHYSLL